MTQSIHTARWVGQIIHAGWDIHVIDAMETSSINPELRGVTAHILYPPSESNCNVKKVHYVASQHLTTGFIRQKFPNLARSLLPSRIDTITSLIKHLKPDILHSLEMQNESYPLLEVKRRLGGAFSMPWIYSSWGSDIFYFGKQLEHEARVKGVLGACDYYIADCRRDVELAIKLGFKGKVLGVFPATGGFDIDGMQSWVQPGPVSGRHIIAVKGFQTWVGRALIAVQALYRCADELRNHKVVVYGAFPEVELSAREFSRTTGVEVEVLPLANTTYETIIRLFGSSRIAIGVSISDGTPLSMLEAMIMGAFPIQSDTISTAEWITHKVNGLLVPPENPDAIANSIRLALSDDSLIDRAAELNGIIARERLDRAVLQPRVIELYKNVAAERLPKYREQHYLNLQ
jgi:glycosyltransferase involved in cell wall biosynthesis